MDRKPSHFYCQGIARSAILFERMTVGDWPPVTRSTWNVGEFLAQGASGENLTLGTLDPGGLRGRCFCLIVTTSGDGVVMVCSAFGQAVSSRVCP